MNDNTTTKTAESTDWLEWEAVKNEEFEYISTYRRHRQDLNDSNSNGAQDQKLEGLVGLAFSGGGIRSATFGLGVLEALKKFDLLRQVDYLSTVSGGGYIGAWLSANCKRTADRLAKAKDTPENKNELDGGSIEHDWLCPKADWKKSIDHLRRYSNYLSPKLSLLSADTWSMGIIWLRNTLPVQLLIIFTIACLLLVPRVIFWIFKNYSHHDVWNYVTLYLLIFAGIGMVINLYYLASTTNNHKPNLRIQSQRTIQVISVIPLMIVSLGYVGILWEQVRLWGLKYNSLGCIIRNDKFACITQDNSFGSIIESIGQDFLKLYEHIGNMAWLDVPAFLLHKPNVFITTLIIIGFSLACVSFISVYTSNKSRLGFKLFISVLASAVATGVLVVIFAGLMFLLGDGPRLLQNNEKALCLAFVWAGPAVLCAFSLAVALIIGMQGRDSSENIREWWSRFGAWLAIYAFASLIFATAAFYAPLWGVMLYYDWPWKTLGTGWIGTTLAGLLAGKSTITGDGNDQNLTTKLKEAVAKVTPFIFIAGLLLAVSMLLHLVIAINSTAVNATFKLSQSTLLGGQHNEHWKLLANSSYWVILVVFEACLICVALFSLRIDINVFSLNNFYRNRLARCYLGATRQSQDRSPHKFTGFDDDDDLKLTELIDGQNQLAGPFHIVNCALNLGGSRDLALHTRHSAIFTLTPLRCGSTYEIKKPNGTIISPIGYAKTKTYGGADQPTLGQAISVSGAAASPNMGYHTSAPVSFLMTLFNARLGWWFPNPCMSDCKQSSPVFSLWYLLIELFGLANEKSEFLAISDGGHFENLAAYELVKRKCKIIIISDGECDPNYQFEGLVLLC